MEENENDEIDTQDEENDSSEKSPTDSKSEDKKPILVVLALLVLLALGAYFIFGMNSTDNTNGLDDIQTEEFIDEDRMDEDATFEQNSVDSERSDVEGESITNDDIQVIEVEGGSYYYNPNVIEVKKGDTVRIVLTSVDMMHDFVIDELDVRTEILKSGETGEVEFTVDEAGEYEYYCSVGNHRAQGMVGTLVITE